MSLRVVLYAEGGLDTGGEEYVLRAPGSPVAPDSLGAAHLLVRRCLQASHRLPEGAVRFEEPLRYRARVARGAMLYNTESLLALLTWPANPRRPELAIVLVDADGDSHRYATLRDATEHVPVPRVIAVAVQELEAWLLADQAAVSQVFGTEARMASSPESLARREAKDQLEQWIRDSEHHNDRTSARRSLASLCDLEEVQRRCPSFARFRKDLGAIGSRS